jgi:hypothetical protein
MKFKLYIATLLVFIGISGCKKNVVEPVIDHSSKYINLAVGNTWIYQMDSIVFSGFSGSTPDTFNYLIKNEVKEAFTTIDGEQGYRIERYFKTDSNSDWKFTRQYSEVVTDLEVLRTDFDQTQITLSLPILLDKTWNSNQYNPNREIETYFEEVHEPAQVGPNFYDSTCLVFHDEEINIINSFFAIERYAANVGLVYREEEQLNFIGTATEAGFKYQLTLLAFERN